MDLVVFQENKPFVLNALRNGDFDYMEAASEVFETEFFRFIGADKILQELAQSYPTPRKKQDVPLWLYVASNLSMRLHGEHSFHGFPLVVRTGGMLNALGSRAGRKVTHPLTGDVTLFCEGFNKKNHYDRESPCDQDYLRKLAKDTRPDALMGWFGRDVVQIFHRQGAFDPDGIFIGDASYLFVPDNPHYEGSVRLRFDEDDHPVSSAAYNKMSPEQKSRCRWRRCYKMVTLLHTNAKLEFFLFVGVQIISGKDHESGPMYALIERFVRGMGKGLIKRLIVDRGFLDGKAISTCKEQYGIDVLIPLRNNMDIYEDALSLFELPEVRWEPIEEPQEKSAEPPRLRPKSIIKREQSRQKTLQKLKEAQPPPDPAKTIVKRETAAIGELRTWWSCSVPLTVIANREHYGDGHEKIWLLADTKSVEEPTEARKEYHLRSSIEERYRQLKCFVDLAGFRSCTFSLVANQVVFIMLAYNLLQFYLLRQQRSELNKKTPPRIRQQLLPSDNHIIVYWENSYGLFSPLEFTEIIATLGEDPRKKVAHKCRRLRRELTESLNNPRSP
jgi:hypothetical protein